MKRLAFAAIATATLMSSTLAAASAYDTRAGNLQGRIDAGVRDGSLTWQESRGLRGELTALRNREYRADRGGLSWAERRDLGSQYDALSNRIYSLRHNWRHNWRHR